VKPRRAMLNAYKFQEWESYAVNTVGRGGSDLTAATIGRDLGSREIQVYSFILYKLPVEITVAI
jgi:hypothetical protein